MNKKKAVSVKRHGKIIKKMIFIGIKMYFRYKNAAARNANNSVLEIKDKILERRLIQAGILKTWETSPSVTSKAKHSILF